MDNIRSETQPIQTKFQTGELQNRVLYCYSYMIHPDRLAVMSHENRM
jgi:hypothetical protein